VKPLTKSQYQTISAIANRAVEIGRAHQPDFRRSKMDIEMDIECVMESQPLDLDALLKADNFNFCHDVFGIARHLNRNTRLLEDCFSPRFSRGGDK
jgi:hypothetical protein